MVAQWAIVLVKIVEIWPRVLVLPTFLCEI